MTSPADKKADSASSMTFEEQVAFEENYEKALLQQSKTWDAFFEEMFKEDPSAGDHPHLDGWIEKLTGIEGFKFSAEQDKRARELLEILFDRYSMHGRDEPTHKAIKSFRDLVHTANPNWPDKIIVKRKNDPNDPDFNPFITGKPPMEEPVNTTKPFLNILHVAKGKKPWMEIVPNPNYKPDSDKKAESASKSADMKAKPAVKTANTEDEWRALSQDEQLAIFDNKDPAEMTLVEFSNFTSNDTPAELVEQLHDALKDIHLLKARLKSQA